MACVCRRSRRVEQIKPPKTMSVNRKLQLQCQYVKLLWKPVVEQSSKILSLTWHAGLLQAFKVQRTHTRAQYWSALPCKQLHASYPYHCFLNPLWQCLKSTTVCEGTARKRSTNWSYLPSAITIHFDFPIPIDQCNAMPQSRRRWTAQNVRAVLLQGFILVPPYREFPFVQLLSGFLDRLRACQNTKFLSENREGERVGTQLGCNSKQQQLLLQWWESSFIYDSVQQKESGNDRQAVILWYSGEAK